MSSVGLIEIAEAAELQEENAPATPNKINTKINQEASLEQEISEVPWPGGEWIKSTIRRK